MSNKITIPVAQEGGPLEALGTERASAAPVDTPKRAPRRPVDVAPASMTLADTQAWFFDAISHPGSVRAGAAHAAATHGAEAAALLTAGPELGPLSRLGVYHFAYRARLVDALADDFPGVRQALGADAFVRLAERVIAAHPSRTRNLNTYGRVLVDWLAAPGRRVRHRGFLHALATLEWALVEVVHAPTPARLDPAAFGALGPERWADLRFRPGPAVRLLELDWPANAWFQAFREGAAPPLPARGWSATAVYRQGFTVWRMNLSPVAYGLLRRLYAGERLGAALAPLEGAARAERVMDWFSAWVSGGLFAGIEDGAG